MAISIITRRTGDPKLIDTPLFHVGQSHEESAVAIFSSEDAATRYIDQAEWKEEQTIAKIDESQLVDWLSKAKQHSVTHVALDLNRQSTTQSEQGAMVWKLDEPGTAAISILEELHRRAV